MYFIFGMSALDEMMGGVWNHRKSNVLESLWTI